MSEYDIRKKVVASILEQFQPVKIYALGGIDVQDQETAAGVNLLVVLEKPASRQATRNFRPGVDPPPGFTVDVRFMTMDEFIESQNVPGRVAFLAAQKGIVVYDKNPEPPKVELPPS